MNSAMRHDRKLASFLTLVTLFVTLSIQIAQGQGSSAIKIPANGSVDYDGSNYRFSGSSLIEMKDGKVVGAIIKMPGHDPQPMYGIDVERARKAIEKYNAEKGGSAATSSADHPSAGATTPATPMSTATEPTLTRGSGDILYSVAFPDGPTVNAKKKGKYMEIVDPPGYGAMKGVTFALEFSSGLTTFGQMLSAGSQNHDEAQRQTSVGGHWSTAGVDARIGTRGWTQEQVLNQKTLVPTSIYTASEYFLASQKLAKEMGYATPGQTAMELITKSQHEGGTSGPNGGQVDRARHSNVPQPSN